MMATVKGKPELERKYSWQWELAGKSHWSQVQWCMPVIPTPERLKQEDGLNQEFWAVVYFVTIRLL